MPETIRAFVQIAHRKVRGHGRAVGRPPLPNGSVREEFAVAPGITTVELLDAHVLRLKHDVSGVIFVPIPMQDASFSFQLTEEGRAGVRSQDVKSRTLQPVCFDPFRGSFEDIGPIVIEAENETTVHLDSITVKNSDAARIVFRDRRALARIGEIASIQRFEPYKHAGTP